MKAARPLASLVLALLLMLASTVGLASLEVEAGRARLVLHEGSGRYSLYIRSAGEPEKFVPLFVDRDPRTSWLSVVVDGRIFRLGEGGEFRESAASIPGGARFTWESKTLRITQEFTFVSPIGATSPSAVRIDLTLTNLGAGPVSLGARDCLDTYLGEDHSAHFRTEPGGDVSSESTLAGDRMIASWISAAKGEEGVACQRLTSGPGITSPDSIVFANWKRLNQVSWSYDTSIGRSFNLLPYSINDSAVCQYYEPVPVAPGESRRIVSIVGSYSSAGYAAGTAAGAPGAVPSPPTTSASGAAQGAASGSRAGAVLAVLESLNDLLRRIDEGLTSGQPLTDEEIRLIREALSGIKSRSEPYLQDH